MITTHSFDRFYEKFLINNKKPCYYKYIEKIRNCILKTRATKIIYIVIVFNVCTCELFIASYLVNFNCHYVKFLCCFFFVNYLIIYYNSNNKKWLLTCPTCDGTGEGRADGACNAADAAAAGRY